MNRTCGNSWDLAALGLVCDVMPMTGLTRVFVAQGLKILGAGSNPGLKALGKRAGVSHNPSTYDLGFLLGPRINAAGRVGHAQTAYDLMTMNDPARLEMLAEKLHLQNAERQEIEAGVQEAALADIVHHQRGEDAVLLAAGEGWHPGVVGIVAGTSKRAVWPAHTHFGRKRRYGDRFRSVDFRRRSWRCDY